MCSLYRDVHEAEFAPVSVAGGKQEAVSAAYEGEFTYLSTTSEDFSQITSQIQWVENLRAPIAKGDVLGEQVYYLGEKEIGRCRILAQEDVEKADFWHCLGKMWELYRV